ncbi:MAG TPA: archaemetzincin family Zn-dependent metalloprotease [Terriglobales bacterium]|nr:archaemetzincin family Zn-dependent metalloprotease [Terriglobales bacterium]
MKRLQLLSVGDLEGRVLEGLAVQLAHHFATPCQVLAATLDPQFAFHAERGQYHSSEILARVQQHVQDTTWRLLAVTGVDLYIPILTFVFGEAQMGGPCALISTHRLRQEFYGLPHDLDLLHTRMLKEAVHELGHTLELTHCDDYRCAMSGSHAVEWIDLKENSFCRCCANRVLEVVGRDPR